MKVKIMLWSVGVILLSVVVSILEYYGWTREGYFVMYGIFWGLWVNKDKLIK